MTTNEKTGRIKLLGITLLGVLTLIITGLLTTFDFIIGFLMGLLIGIYTTTEMIIWFLKKKGVQ